MQQRDREQQHGADAVDAEQAVEDLRPHEVLSGTISWIRISTSIVSAASRNSSAVAMNIRPDRLVVGADVTLVDPAGRAAGSAR